ncbi:Nn.00g004730.m01.CDS01 [Neocucurbitaria sp. VM-36]
MEVLATTNCVNKNSSINVARANSAKSLDDLPDEILLLVFSHVDPRRVDRILGHLEDDPPPTPPDHYLIQDFFINTKGLRSLALTCKRFLSLAREQLLHTPIIGELEFDTPSELAQTRIVSLISLLLSHSGRRRHVKQLRLCLPFYERNDGLGGQPGHSVQLSKPKVSKAFMEQAHQVIDSLKLPLKMKKRLSVEMSLNFESALVGLLLALVPQLERLCISQSTQLTRVEPIELYRYLRHPFVVEFESSTRISPQGFRCPTIYHNLTYLKVISPPTTKFFGLDLLPNLRSLDMSTKLANLTQETINNVSELYASPDTQKALRNICRLRLDFQIKSVGIWDIGARVCLTSILQAVHNLQSLDCYAEPSDSKNPFRSVRTFPHYQANIQNYPDESARLDPHVETQQYWDQRIYDARTDITDYQNLVDAIVHLRPRLESLRLPGGFWTLPGGMRKPLPRFVSFTQLRTLVVPQAAIISIKLDNMRFADVSGDFDLSPVTLLPPSLQDLKVFDAELSLLESNWLRDLFTTQKSCNLWPGLHRLEILFGTYRKVDVDKLLTRSSHQLFWAWVDEATFEVLIGKDGDVPMVCV